MRRVEARLGEGAAIFQPVESEERMVEMYEANFSSIYLGVVFNSKFEGLR